MIEHVLSCVTAQLKTPNQMKRLVHGALSSSETSCFLLMQVLFYSSETSGV